jgi:hypothetical protein
VIRGGGQSSGPMILKPRAKGAQGSEDHLCKRNCLVAGPISGWSSMSEGGSHLDVGGETTMGKEASASFFLLIDGGEREREGRSRSSTSGMVGRRLAGPVKPRHDIGSPAPCH